MQIHPNSLKLTRDRRTVTSRQAYHKRHHVTVRLSDTPQIHLVSPTLVYVYRHDIQCIYHLKIRHMPHNNQQQVNSIPFAKRKTQNIRYHKIRDIASATSSVMSVFAFPYIFLCPRGIEKHTQHGVLILKKKHDRFSLCKFATKRIGAEKCNRGSIFTIREEKKSKTTTTKCRHSCDSIAYIGHQTTLEYIFEFWKSYVYVLELVDKRVGKHGAHTETCTKMSRTKRLRNPRRSNKPFEFEYNGILGMSRPYSSSCFFIFYMNNIYEYIQWRSSNKHTADMIQL